MILFHIFIEAFNSLKNINKKFYLFYLKKNLKKKKFFKLVQMLSYHHDIVS